MVNVSKEVETYFRVAFLVTKLMKNKYKTIYLISSWKKGDIKRQGEFNRYIEYQFHGLGCTYEFNKCKIDNINVDYDGDKIVIDPWKVSCFLKDNYDVQMDSELIERNINYIFNNKSKIKNINVIEVFIKKEDAYL